jgi:hypothetical protein
MRAEGLKREAQYVKPAGGCDTAWFYETPQFIQVYAYRAGERSRWCWIPRAMLESYLKRSRHAAARRKERK